MTTDIELRFQKELARTPDPVEFAMTFPKRMTQAIQSAKSPEDANTLRALASMGTAYLKQALPRVVQNRHEHYLLMYPTESAYLDASAKAGELWAVTENKRDRGGNGNNQYARNSNGGSNSSVMDAGFKSHIDATRCVRIAALDTQDLDIYKNERIQNEEHITISGAERVWGLLNNNVHVSNNSGENEWYTPPVYIEAARKVMGSIDTDPASSELANKTVKAETYYTEQDDGRIQTWTGNVWMNPPYSQPLISEFSEAFAKKYNAGEFEQACVLVNNATETNWYQSFLTYATAVCFLKGRVKFIDQNGDASGAPLQGQTVLYFGNNEDSFEEVFSKFGRVLYGRR